MGHRHASMVPGHNRSWNAKCYSKKCSIPKKTLKSMKRGVYILDANKFIFVVAR